MSLAEPRHPLSFFLPEGTRTDGSHPQSSRVRERLPRVRTANSRSSLNLPADAEEIEKLWAGRPGHEQQTQTMRLIIDGSARAEKAAVRWNTAFRAFSCGSEHFTA